MTRRSQFNRLAWRVANLFLFMLLPLTNRGEAAEPLTIGSPAPTLDIEHWISDRQGQFKPVKQFEPDKVYVVEFWATWCGPCVASMPHLAKLQNDFADKKVQIISISDEDLATVQGFLKRELREAAGNEETTEKTPKTYAELTSAYCLTTDPDGSTQASYMQAAEQRGIPCAFIVGKDQRIEFIGHPVAMGEALQQVVDGTWDREAYAIEFEEQKYLKTAMARITRLAQRDPETAIAQLDEVLRSVQTERLKLELNLMKLQLLAQAQQTEKALELADLLIANPETQPIKSQLQLMRIQFLFATPEDARLKQSIVQFYKDYAAEPININYLAMAIAEQFEGDVLKDAEILKISRSAVEQTTKKLTGDSLAAALYIMAGLMQFEGDTESAIKSLERSMSLASNPQLREQLELLMQKLKSPPNK